MAFIFPYEFQKTYIRSLGKVNMINRIPIKKCVNPAFFCPLLKNRTIEPSITITSPISRKETNNRVILFITFMEITNNEKAIIHNWMFAVASRLMFLCIWLKPIEYLFNSHTALSLLYDNKIQCIDLINIMNNFYK